MRGPAPRRRLSDPGRGLQSPLRGEERGGGWKGCQAAGDAWVGGEGARGLRGTGRLSRLEKPRGALERRAETGGARGQGRARGAGTGREGTRFPSPAATSPIGFSSAGGGGREGGSGREGAAHGAGASGSLSDARCCVWPIPWKEGGELLGKAVTLGRQGEGNRVPASRFLLERGRGARQPPCTPHSQTAAGPAWPVCPWSYPLRGISEPRLRLGPGFCLPSPRPAEVPGFLAAQTGRGRPGKGTSLGKRMCARRAGGGRPGWMRGTGAPRPALAPWRPRARGQRE